MNFKTPAFFAIIVVICILAFQLLWQSDAVFAIERGVAILVLLAQITLVLFLILLYFKKKNKLLEQIHEKIAEDGQNLALVFATAATAGSLFYSQIIGYVPCELCWYQRIFMYPLTLLIAASIYKKQKDFFDYVLPMALIGSVISIYHYGIQFLNFSAICGVTNAASCSERSSMYFGYITIPLMALTAFVSVAICMYLKKMHNKSASRPKNK